MYPHHLQDRAENFKATVGLNWDKSESGNEPENGKWKCNIRDYLSACSNRGEKGEQIGAISSKAFISIEGIASCSEYDLKPICQNKQTHILVSFLNIKNTLKHLPKQTNANFGLMLHNLRN